MHKDFERKLNSIIGFIFEINKNSGTLTSDSEIIRNSVEFNNWFSGNDVKILFSDIDTIQNHRMASVSVKDYYTGKFIRVDNELYIPVGSIEFVEAFMGKEITPIDMLKIFDNELMGRRIEICTLENIYGVYKRFGKDELFIKDAEGTKKIEPIICNIAHFNNWYKSQINAGVSSKRKFIVSSVIDIQAEWRCFVYNGKLCGCQQYIGDFWQIPEANTINIIVNQLKNKLKLGAFTIDVGICNGNTYIIEMHNLISCGLYGFESNHLYKMIKLAYMLECTGSLGGVQIEKEG